MITRLTGKWFQLNAFAYATTPTHKRITVEHLFQSRKASTNTERRWILESSTPTTAKSRGRIVTLPSGWDDGLRVDAMREAIREVFMPGTEQSRLLLSTSNEYIQHGNNHGDTFWGRVRRVGGWEGDNMYGELLMERRSELRDGIDK